MNNLNRESSASDRDLWQAFLAGDREAFARLFHLYSDAMYAYGRRLLPMPNWSKTLFRMFL
ncbi:hypothetical protein JCM15093_2157 [Bacteroides graminisolvens DSM 19988 = JCM 15093]|uniref:RNA polymerase ECF-type sigma factor n=1 Tax=Bacteroides graminisolvens DSM 19988 = JCM 15093 TaxID=1121097 RepID=A0A069D3P1_9BACE|nr:hypothetical protein [Bacteroides graminisolvens]GAK36950.1 hypothetical protein JCM15093_2157 [Bacteroides graminisolvens DSM 19988 = JCM 15093]